MGSNFVVIVKLKRDTEYVFSCICGDESTAVKKAISWLEENNDTDIVEVRVFQVDAKL